MIAFDGRADLAVVGKVKEERDVVSALCQNLVGDREAARLTIEVKRTAAGYGILEPRVPVMFPGDFAAALARVPRQASCGRAPAPEKRPELIGLIFSVDRDRVVRAGAPEILPPL